MAGRLGQLVAALAHIQEGKGAYVRHAERDVQVLQAQVTVNSQDPAAVLGQSRCHSRADGGFARSALAGQDGDQFTQCTSPHSQIRNYYNGISHKNQEEMK